MLDVWKFALSISGGDVKLEKYSWKIKYYYWKEGQYLLKHHYPYQLKVILNGITQPFEFTPQNETRTLVRATVNPDNESK